METKWDKSARRSVHDQPLRWKMAEADGMVGFTKYAEDVHGCGRSGVRASKPTGLCWDVKYEDALQIQLIHSIRSMSRKLTQVRRSCATALFDDRTRAASGCLVMDRYPGKR